MNSWKLPAEFNDIKHTKGSIYGPQRIRTVQEVSFSFAMVIRPLDAQYTVFGRLLKD